MAAASPSHTPTRLQDRIVSHWAKTTPEEGIQLRVNTTDVQHSGASGIHMQTRPPSTERPCQWNISLRLVNPPTPASSESVSGSISASTAEESISTAAEAQPRAGIDVDYALSSTLLNLTIERVIARDMGTGTGQYIEDPTSQSRMRCDAYRTLYVYSPKLRRDICVHSIKREAWPQLAVFDSIDVSENDDKEYHFQIWLSGSSPRQMDTKTIIRFDRMQRLLRAMRRDKSTADVEIVIREESSRDQGRHHERKERVAAVDTAVCNRIDKTAISKEPDISDHRGHGDLRPCRSIPAISSSFRAHKCILESVPFFSRMLNGSFREAYADVHGMYKIELSSDMFDADIMEHLLDYIYTHEPIMESGTPPLDSNNPGVPGPPLETQVHHVISTNVGLNLQTVVHERRIPSLQHSSRVLEQSTRQFASVLPNLTPKHWAALYKAGVHLEDKELQSLALAKFQERLDPETTLDQVLTWGVQHEEIKAMMMQYLIKKRRQVFGDEQSNKLRPYLWAEYEDQVETLVEITSQIARQ
ncbi:hypothetical protein BGX28_005553 [Mortierella sp. GBA30]|nr:hypothetical protein BGX28_005553 [Mortierella sp. GBA30]